MADKICNSIDEAIEKSINKPIYDPLQRPMTEAERAGLPTVPHEATRFDTGCRLDLLEPDFLEAMGIIMAVGAKKYGENNWKKGLLGEKSGHNHALKHLLEFRQGVKNDYGEMEMHYAQVAINAMFQFYEEKKKRLENF